MNDPQLEDLLREQASIDGRWLDADDGAPLAVTNPAEHPFLPLLEFLPQGRELGLHVVLARRTGGADSLRPRPVRLAR